MAKRVRTPVILQMESVECGAAALGIVLAYHGRHISLEELRVACGVSRDGSKASKLIHAARNFGLEAQGVKAEPDELAAEAKTPFIAFVDFNHFLVVEGFGKNKVYLNDPALGRQTISAQRFSERFTGVALLFEPSAAFAKNAPEETALVGLARRVQGVRPALTFAILASLALVVPGIVLPVFSKVFVDEILLGAAENWLAYLLAGMAATAVVRAVFTWFQQTSLLRLENRLNVDGAERFMAHLLRLPMNFFAQRHASEIGPRLALNAKIASLLSRNLATHALNLVSMLFFAGAMVLYDPLLAGVSILFALANAGVLAAAHSYLGERYQRLTLDQVQLHGAGIATLASIESAKAQGLEDRFFQRWAARHDAMIASEQELGRLQIWTHTVPYLFNGLNVIAVITLGGLAVMEGRMSVGGLIAFQSLLASFSSPLTGLLDIGPQFQEAKAGLQRIDDTLKAQPAVDFVTAQENQNLLTGRVEVRGLSFGYDPTQPPLLQEIDLSIEPGERVALVGGSGSGKSTIARLIAGLENPRAGEVRFDDLLIGEIDRLRLTASMAFVDQDIVLFEGTIRDNLTLWHDGIEDARLWRALADVGMADAVAARPGGLDAVLADDGMDWSGGQRQRLEIARALAIEPSLLILDEATSALDRVSEAQIMTAIRRRGAACLIIAHRFTSIADCDCIHVIENGYIHESGTFDELMRLSGRFAELARA